MQDHSPKTVNNFNKILRYFGFIMVIFYFIVGGFLLISDRMLAYLTPIQKNGIGIVIIIYGIFRGYRVYKDQKVNTN